jgi:glycosyltransferase involved in cell wall biosynthesis
MKLLYVVHRYPPYMGGSEYYVQAMAEESRSRGHQVSVYTNQHNGNLNGINVTSNLSVIFEDFDLIIVHGGNCGNQNIVHENSATIKSKILYLLILPSTTEICMKGLHNAKFLGCSTKADWDHVKKFNVEHKSHRVRHGIKIPTDESKVLAENHFRKKFGITSKYIILSCGGFWRHKGMMELSEIFKMSNCEDTTLVLTGYHNDPRHKPQETENIKCLYLEDRADVSNGLAAADLYIMNSYEEGYGLVLLEAMAKKVPWVARNIAGAVELQQFGYTYSTNKELHSILCNFKNYLIPREGSYEHVLTECSIKNTVDDILLLLK